MRSDYLLDKGIEKLEKQLDVSNLINNQQLVRIIKNVLFDEDEKFLLQFQKNEVLDVGSSTSSSDQSDEHEHEDEILGKLCRENYDQFDKKAQSDRKKFRTNVKRRLKKYEGRRIDQIEFRVLQGILSRHFSYKEKKREI